ncbi:MAG: UDP-glucose 4-epimerase GalE [Planctomycetes bacterium]|nr:UDP-glucose 4-epimerase GalE [Planctomycetota bacterium]
MRVLVTGGAGFIGSVTGRALRLAGHEIAILDDFSTGHDWACIGKQIFRADLRDRAGLDAAFGAFRPEAVMHFAAKAVVPESVANPGLYYDVNVVGSLRLLEAMRLVGCRKIVFSSSAAVYGTPEKSPIDEQAPQHPINPYGRTKKHFEEVLEDVRPADGLAYASLRYFNACGAAPEWHLGEIREPETHLLPIVIRATMKNQPFTVCGTDYETRDGTCVRDYVDVRDLADAHVRALERLRPGQGAAYNLGSELGTTVREVVAAVGKVLGKPVPFRDGPRRAGDPATLVASCAKARAELGWTPRRPLEESIRSVVEFLQSRGG